MIEGKKWAESLLKEYKREGAFLTAKPKIHFILVGEDSASHLYVKRKQKVCEEVGFLSGVSFFEENISQDELLQEIERINRDLSTHALLVQMPLPGHIDPEVIVEKIAPEKDVDGFHPLNMGKLLRGNKNGLIPCTPLGIQFLLNQYKIDLSQKRVLILGRSNVVGKPLAALLMQKEEKANATVTIAHSKTPHLKELTLSCDVLICCMGKAHFIKGSMVKKGAVVMDVGINRITLAGKTQLVGDVCFKEVVKKASLITPVPGGIGPMTIAMLIKNTLFCYKLQQKRGFF